MLRDIWENYGDYSVIRRFRLVCREFSRELRPLSVYEEKWMSGVYCSPLRMMVDRRVGRYQYYGDVFQHEYKHDGVGIAATLDLPDGNCCMVLGIRWNIYNTSAENVYYYDEAIFPSTRKMYVNLTKVGIGENTYPAVDKIPPPKGLVRWNSDDQQRTDIYIMLYNDGYGILYGRFDIGDPAEYSTYALWKMTPLHKN